MLMVRGRRCTPGICRCWSSLESGRYHSASPSLLHKPKSVEDIVDQTVSGALDLFNIEVPDEAPGEDIGENPNARRSKDE